MVKLNCTKLNFAIKNDQILDGDISLRFPIMLRFLFRAYRSVYAPSTVLQLLKGPEFYGITFDNSGSRYNSNCNDFAQVLVYENSR